MIDCYLIEHFGENYILFQIDPDNNRAPQFCASSRHVQPLVDLLPKRPLTLEVRV